MAKKKNIALPVTAAPRYKPVAAPAAAKVVETPEPIPPATPIVTMAVDVQANGTETQIAVHELAAVEGAETIDAAPVPNATVLAMAGGIHDADLLMRSLPEGFGEVTEKQQAIRDLADADPYDVALNLLEENKSLIRYSSGLWGAPTATASNGDTGIVAVAGGITDGTINRLLSDGIAHTAETRFGRPREVVLIERPDDPHED